MDFRDFNICITNFNPRSHEESGHPSCFHLLHLLYFNPRSHEESGLRNDI